jgi:predicted Zn-ribbon and HTH transcriptional regulator
VEWLYHCNNCSHDFDQPKVKDPRGKRLSTCPECQSENLAAWEDWKANEALKD